MVHIEIVSKNQRIPTDSSLEIEWKIRPCFEILAGRKIRGMICSGWELNDEDLARLSKMDYAEGIRSLIISDNNLTSIASLKPMKSLIYLDCSKNQITSLNGCPRFLITLFASHNKIASIQGVSRCKDLQALSMSFNKGSSPIGMGPLGSLENLSALNISHCYIDLPTLRSFRSQSNLEVFEGAGIGLTGLEFLETNIDLQEIHVPYNQIDNLQALRKLGKLTVVSLSCNYIQSLGGLEGSAGSCLESLVVANNPIETFGEQTMLSARVLDVSGTRISLAELERLSGIAPNLAVLVHSCKEFTSPSINLTDYDFGARQSVIYQANVVTSESWTVLTPAPVLSESFDLIETVQRPTETGMSSPVVARLHFDQEKLKHPEPDTLSSVEQFDTSGAGDRQELALVDIHDETDTSQILTGSAGLGGHKSSEELVDIPSNYLKAAFLLALWALIIKLFGTVITFPLAGTLLVALGSDMAEGRSEKPWIGLGLFIWFLGLY